MGMEQLEALKPDVERSGRAYVIVWGLCFDEQSRAKQSEAS